MSTEQNDGKSPFEGMEDPIEMEFNDFVELDISDDYNLDNREKVIKQYHREKEYLRKRLINCIDYQLRMMKHMKMQWKLKNILERKIMKCCKSK